jgi:hypothetical protein
VICGGSTASAEDVNRKFSKFTIVFRHEFRRFKVASFTVFDDWKPGI